MKGVFDPTKLVEYVYKRTGKHAVIVKQEPEKKEKEESKDVKKEEKKVEESGGGDGGDDKGSKAEEENKEKKAEEAKPPEATVVVATEETNKVVEVQTNAYYHYPQHALEMYAYPPQMFSDENPNACSIMWKKVRNLGW